MANLLYLSADVVEFGNTFSSSKTYIFKNQNQQSIADLVYTKVVYSPSLRIYQETDTGRLITDYSKIAIREALAPKPPVSGPFIENYSLDGTLNSDNYVNLLFVDKPPIRTGFFSFFIDSKEISFTGVIRKITRYTIYNWELLGSKYGYKASFDQGLYAIEISKNLLYTASLVNSNYVYIPTSLNIALRNLTGGEEIRSSATVAAPSTYIQSIPGEPAGTSGVLPINVFYISEEDALRYIASYPDLILSFGTNYVLGQAHYASNSAAEGRVITFNPISYLNKYSDLKQTYGYDTYSATIHYITTGYSQGRTFDSASDFNPLNGGLYDERYNYITASNNYIIWPRDNTIAANGKILTYKFNTQSYYINGDANVSGNVLYLGIQ